MLELTKYVSRPTLWIVGSVFFLCFVYRLLVNALEANWGVAELLPALWFASVPGIITLLLGLFYNRISLRRAR